MAPWLYGTNSYLNVALLISASCIFAVTSGYDTALMNGLNILPAYKSYFKLTTATKALLTSSTYIGSSVSCIAFGYVANIIGRKRSIILSAIVKLIGVVLMASAQNVAMFCLGRIFLGLGSGISGTVAPAWLAETLPVSFRGRGLSLIYAVWYVGSLLAAGVTYGTSSYVGDAGWRIPAALQAIFSVLCLIILGFTPESPRWLVYRGRNDEALDIIARTHSNGDMNDPVTLLQYKEIVDTLNWEKENGESLGYWEILKTKGSRKRVMLACSVAVLNSLSGNSIVSYYLGTMLTNAGIKSSHTQLEINICLSAFCLVIAMIGSQLSDKMGRRPMALISVGALTVFMFIVGGLTAGFGSGGNQSGVFATVAMIFLFQGSYSFGCTNMTTMYPPEVLNYSIRTTGMAMWTMTVNLLGLFVTFAFPFALAAISWKLYMINAGWDVLEFAYIYFCWIETRGKTMEEIDRLIDGEKHSDVPDLEVVVQGKIDVSDALANVDLVGGTKTTKAVVQEV
ncbi:hypothetical protein BP5796_00806 [Coleophoma crateriformis]|uniref:Major facilitator superfamily (MFS) profile domain-containing protein n=1 Tax=Coleophoma crateriformis TaxID=565419 RepID=A0A3D8T906_9HELO|nr:hypothetical protein BP5796_00806 [Coleophoma crateriformis]